MKTLKPCGTASAYKRHHARGEPVDEACKEAHRQEDAQRRQTKGITPRIPTPDLIEDITFLLNAGEGEHAILKATGYTGRHKALKARLQKHGQTHLYHRITNNHWELAA
jgi:hypothetical protein